MRTPVIRPSTPSRLLTALMLPFILLAASAVQVGAQEKRPLDHSVYDEWKEIGTSAISDDGAWVLYTVQPRDGGDGVLMVRSTRAETVYSVPHGTGARFTGDSRYVVCLIDPAEESVEEARRAGQKPDEQPKSMLGIVRLADGEVAEIERVRSFRLAERSSAFVAYLMEREPAAAEEGAEEEAAGEEAEQETKRPEDVGTMLVLRRLENESERSFQFVTDYALTPDDAWLLAVVSAPEEARDGVYGARTGNGEFLPLLTGPGRYLRLALDEEGRQAAFLSDRDDQGAEQPALSLYHWRAGADSVRPVAGPGSAGIPADWWVSEHSTPSFSPNGRRLFFGTAPRPEPEPEEDPQAGESEESQVVLDIWHWQDPLLQPQQLLQVDQERRRSFQAVVHLADVRIVQLEDAGIPDVSVGAGGDAGVAMAATNVPYLKRQSWDTPGWSDVYLIDVDTGERRGVMQEVQVNIRLSPDARYLTWWDYAEQAWFAMNTDSGTVVDLSSDIPYPVGDELHDTPSPTPPYGTAGFTEGDELLLIYDAHDIWAADPSGREPPRCITEEIGRDSGLRFRFIDTDPEEEGIDPRERFLLSAFDTQTKAAGFYRDRVQGSGLPEELLMQDARFGTPRKAAEADVVLFTRESYTEFPDLWAADMRLRDARRLSEANPQMSEFLWGTAETYRWESADGQTLEGILYKPEGFDPARTYPMMVTFYERSSDNLHQHWAPEPHRSIINYTFYASRGYLVFLPDVPYRIGYPGESAINAVVPGVLSLIDEGFVDRERIGVAGHSWGGYQIAFMITRTNLFRAAEAGAPVSNMVSAYGGIRWASGMSRMFQYERTQSRIGLPLWEAPLRYIENSPIFWADKIETPLLIMHNDEDGAVPWEQGIELFVALRRLEKPAWMIVYNEQPHWPITWPNKKDWAARLQQYFDHFLKDAPAPVWIAEGVPAIMKGRTLGRELVGSEPPPQNPHPRP